MVFYGPRLEPFEPVLLACQYRLGSSDYKQSESMPFGPPPRTAEITIFL